MAEDLKAWINGTLIGPGGRFAPIGFASSLTLYRTPLAWSLVLSIVDGVARPAPFRVADGGSPYDALIRSVQRASEDEPASWFYVVDPDNALSVLEWTRPCRYQGSPDDHLESFERTPAAEGGRSWLGLLGSSRRWLLLHEYDPANSLDISIHGPPGFCREVAAGVGVEAHP